MKKIFFIIITLIPLVPCAAQVNYLLRGTVVDANTGEPLGGVAVFDRDNPGGGVASDNNGAFSISIALGIRTVVCSFLGYETLETAVETDGPTDVVFRMRSDSRNIEEVVVTSKSRMERISNVQIGVEKIEIAEMARVPALFGERDIIRSLQFLPGVKAESDASAGFQVRGGTAAQNLILLDDAPVYNCGHLMGIFSTFNDEALSTASLYKGQIPGQFGGATSAVFDINTKSGDMQRYKVDGSVGLLSAKLNVEGPIARDKASFFVAARRSYLDLFLKLAEDYKNNTLNFYDINAKINYIITDRDKLFVSVFTGRDNMGLDDLMSMKWGNSTATVRWFHQFGDRLYSNTSAIFSSYSSDDGMEILERDYTFHSFIRQAGFKEAFTWTPNGRHELKFGFQSVYLSMKSAEWIKNFYPEKEQRDAWENTLWLNEQWNIGEKLNLSAGLRFIAFSALGGSPYYRLDDEGDIIETYHYGKRRIVKTHYILEPRFSANFRINEMTSLKAGYSRTSQNIHALRNSSMSLPFDRYAISSNLVKPQTADQVSLGYVALTGDSKYEFSTEAYFKSVNDVLDYKDGKSYSSEIEIERLILSGKGRGYGVEFYARKNEGPLTGWISYTLSWSDNKIEGINGGKWYTAGNDRRHDISVVGMYELPRGWQMAATWVYNTGQALTAPSAKYQLNGETVYYYAERNGYRAPDYHRLDISATHTKKKRRYTREWAFGIYNVYCRHNPFVINFENDESKPSGTKTVQTSLFGLIPSVSYNFKF